MNTKVSLHDGGINSDGQRITTVKVRKRGGRYSKDQYLVLLEDEVGDLMDLLHDWVACHDNYEYRS